MSAPASVSATLSASFAAGGAMSAEGAMSKALAHVKAVKRSDEIKECFVSANSINTPIGNDPHSKITHSKPWFAQQVSKAGPAYKIPTRRDVGVSVNRSVSSGEREFGRVLKTGLDLATTAEKQGFSRMGLCSQQEADIPTSSIFHFKALVFIMSN